MIHFFAVGVFVCLFAVSKSKKWFQGKVDYSLQVVVKPNSRSCLYKSSCCSVKLYHETGMVSKQPLLMVELEDFNFINTRTQNRCAHWGLNDSVPCRTCEFAHLQRYQQSLILLVSFSWRRNINQKSQKLCGKMKTVWKITF